MISAHVIDGSFLRLTSGDHSVDIDRRLGTQAAQVAITQLLEAAAGFTTAEAVKLVIEANLALS